MSEICTLSNIIMLTDSYKVSHARQYKPGTTEVYSYFESRGGMFDEIVFFGLQYIIKRYLMKPITRHDIDRAAAMFKLHFGNEELFNREGWEHILYAHDGYLPVSIKAVAEGTVVPTRNAMMTVVNTDPKCFWLTNYLETLLSQVWYPCTVATLSRQQKKYIKAALEKSADTTDGLMFKLHDFGFRGVSSVETAGIGGLAHLVNFMGTDTMVALIFAAEYYNCEMAGFSIPASEHSTITSWGRENEGDACENMLDQYPNGLVANISDSFNIDELFSEVYGKRLKNKILNRNGTLVARFDSGDPQVVVPRGLKILTDQFGYSLNSKNYKVLPPQLRTIQGDGIDIDSLPPLLDAIMDAGFSIDNIAFGSGGGLLQKVNRDTCKFAFKCSSVVTDGKRIDVYKDPIDDPGKKSKRGQMKLVKNDDGVFVTVGIEDPRKDYLVEVYRNGKLFVDHTLDEIRERAAL